MQNLADVKAALTQEEEVLWKPSSTGSCWCQAGPAQSLCALPRVAPAAACVTSNLQVTSLCSSSLAGCEVLSRVLLCLGEAEGAFSVGSKGPARQESREQVVISEPFSFSSYSKVFSGYFNWNITAAENWKLSHPNIGS